MSFMDFFKNLFGGKPAAPAAPAIPQQKTGNSTNNTTVARAKNKQVYEGRQTEEPEWAQGKSASDLLVLLKEHNQCKHVPLFEMKTIMSSKVGPDGNLVPEYNGIAGSCGAIKSFGMKVAQQNGMTDRYRYFDLNNAYRACCGNPKKCPFFMCAMDENDTVNSRRH